MIPLSDACKTRIRILFKSESNRAEVEKALIDECGDNLPLFRVSSVSGYDRIRFAVLKLSKADIEHFRKLIEGNKIDWRDTLVAADFANNIRAHEEWMPKTDVQS